MCRKTLNYLPCKLKFKSTLLIFAVTIFLSACGIKGELYQTPVQADLPKDKETEALVIDKPADEHGISSPKPQASTSSIAQGKEQQ
ncbi:MAG: lipoprotein [Colwellia sp.]